MTGRCAFSALPYACLALRKGRYEHINQAALAGRLRRIAWRVMIQRREPKVEELVDTFENIPEAGAGVAQELGDQRLFESLLRQFDDGSARARWARSRRPLAGDPGRAWTISGRKSH